MPFFCQKDKPNRMNQIPIEDFFEDIIAKSMRGLHITEAEVAAATGEDPETLRRLCRGEFCDEVALQKVARALRLDAEALTIAASKAWYPKPVNMDGLEIFNTPYRDMRVNAFLVWDPASNDAACFDTGTDSSGMIEKANELGLTISQIFITHTHNDHIADLDRLVSSLDGDVTVHSNKQEPWPGTETFSEGDTFSIGGLKVDTRTTHGHSVGGTTFVINGLTRPVAVVGDAVFAGSMGGGMVSFEDAWRTNREKIFTLEDDTVICPGHGPMTSVGEEKKQNPFFAGEFRS